MKSQYVVIIEYAKGTDKSFDGFRPDTKPLLQSFEKHYGIKGEVVFYRPKHKAKLFAYIQQKATVVISRINPGNLKGVESYFQFLKTLSQEGIKVHTHPDVMINLDFKDILFKLKQSPVGDSSTRFYQNYNDFAVDFPSQLRSDCIRVLKTNYGSTGEGVFLVSLKEDGAVVSQEAVNNKKYYFDTLEEFVAAFEKKFLKESKRAKYFKGKSGFVDCRYLPRISEGEIRVLLVKEKPVSIVHKKPQKGEFSATLFSGAQYQYESPQEPKWQEVVQLTHTTLESITPFLQGQEYPLLWTMDYILDYDESGKDIFVLSEINCSCVGISTQLQLCDEVVKAAF